MGIFAKRFIPSRGLARKGELGRKLRLRPSRRPQAMEQNFCVFQNVFPRKNQRNILFSDVPLILFYKK